MASASSKTDLQKALKKCRSYFVTAGFFSLFINITMLVPPLYMLQVYDRVITSRSVSTLILLTLLVIVLLLTMGVLEWVRSQVLVKSGAKLDVLLNERLFKATFKNSLNSGGAQSSAQPVSDLTGLRQFLTGNGLFAFFDAPWLPIYIAVMFMFHPYFGWTAVFAVIVLIILAFINEKTSAKPLSEANKVAIASNNFLNKNLRNVEVIESMGMMENIRLRWQKMNNQVINLQAVASKRAGLVSSISKSFRMIIQSMVLGLGAYLAILQEITPGLMIAGSILLGRALAPIDLMIGSWKGFVSARGSYARLNELLSIVPAEKETMSLPDPQGHLSVEGIVVVPPGARLAVLKSISFSVNKGESVAIIGPSAAGKSTLARTLLGLWPAQSGKVRLDSADIYSWNRIELGQHIGYLPQDIELFDGTISENIARFGELSPADIIKAAQAAGVHEMILRLPDGYDTIIGGHGGVLSGGQRQRIGLARALYGEPAFIVLDEPNSNLDEQGEQALSVALQGLKQRGCTVIIISHKVNIISHVDKILVLADGVATLFGSRDEVLAQLTQAAEQQKKAAIKTKPAVTSVKPSLPV
ncbi:MAG: type I secretion system permease/ATPase [gamma proteobacterium symbiont of Taylorina sp.]|nr:type I secretion system permease/ATPase [gamma proteobacterium symbiont of Taylorina sp.]